MRGEKYSPRPKHMTLRLVSTESTRTSNRVLPVTSADLVFSAAPGNEPEMFDRRQGETRPGPRYEETDSGGTLRSGDTPDFGKGSLSIPNGPTPPGESQPNRRLDSDGDDIR